MRRFSGDARHRLPEAMVEPYRLWFIALQLAHRTKTENINKRFYRQWGDVESLSFSDWWHDHWRDLFGVSIGVREVVDAEDFGASTDRQSLVVRIPLDQTFTTSVKELRAIYDELPANRKTTKPAGKFQITGRSKFRRADIRRYLKSYEYRLQGLTIKEIAVAYCKWAEEWDHVRGKRPAIQPSTWRTFLRAIDSGETIDGAHNAYRSVRRMVKRGEKIVTNTARGEFPGAY